MTAYRVLLLLLGFSFQLLLFGQPQSNSALDVLLVVDNSGSMHSIDSTWSLSGALSAFAGRLPPDSTLGIIAFDNKANVILESSPAAGGHFQSDVRTALARLKYKGSLSDLPGAVEVAIYEFRQRARPNARRAMILVTDGVLDLGNARLTAERHRWLRDGLASEARLHEISIFGILVSQSADFQLFQTLSRVTGGEYYRALNPAELRDALTEITHLTTAIGAGQPNLSGPPRPALSRGILGRASVLAAVAVILVLFSLVVLFTRKHLLRPNATEVNTTLNEPIPARSLAAVREQAVVISKILTSAADLVAQANLTVQQLQTAVDGYAVSSFQMLQDADEQCFTFARECLLLLDHLNIMIQEGRGGAAAVSSLTQARDRLYRVLEAAQIEEIAVNAGDRFDGRVQVVTGIVESDDSKGIVMEVSRKGYSMRAKGRRDVIIRPAEVTVSGPGAVEKPASGGRV